MVDYIGLGFVAAALALYMGIAYRMRARSAEEFYVAGRRVSPLRNGMAVAADWMSGASFISMAGAIALLGYDGGPYLIGWSLSYVLMGMLIAPYLRKYGKYTVPEFFSDRYYSKSARILAVLMTFVVSTTYLTAQLAGVGVVLSRIFGVSAALGALIAPLLVLLYSTFGGMKSITWTQVAQYVILITAYWIPVIIVSAKLGLWKPIPHIGYGSIVEKVDSMTRDFELWNGHSWTDPYARGFAGGSGGLNWILSAIALMLGTLGLPHVLSRFYTVPDVKAARKSVAWALFFIGLLYLTAPVYAALAYNKILGTVYAHLQAYDGQSIGAAKQALNSIGWVEKWASTGLVKIVDVNGNGVFDFPKDISIHKDIIVIGMPDMYGLGAVIAAIIAVGGLSAALSTADGLILAMDTAATRDLYKGIIKPTATEREEVFVARLLMFVIAGFTGALAYGMVNSPRIGAYVAKTVGWAFAFAASTLSPAMILGIWWKRTTKEGAIAGMLAGLAVTLPYVVGVSLKYFEPVSIMGNAIGTIAWGVIGFLVNIVVTVIVSLKTQPPPSEVQELVEKIKLP